MWYEFDDTLKLLFFGLLLWLLALQPYSSFSEEKIYLTETEFNQIQEALTLSETELNLSKMELQKAQTLLTEAQNISSKVLNTQETLLKQFNEREAYWIEQNNALQKEVKSLNLYIKVGSIAVGIGGLLTIVITAIGG
jgi:Skp family chaperone for outer membrane proteins